MQHQRTVCPPGRRRGRKVVNAAVALALMGILVAWGSTASSPALAQGDEELFTPYEIAGLLGPIPMPIGVPSSEAVSLPLAETREPSWVVVVRGVRLVKRREYATAIALLEPYRGSDDFLALHALGVAYVRTQRNAEAYDVLRRAHELNPSVAGPLLPAALACVRMAIQCDEYRSLAQEYLERGGKFRKLADKIINHHPYTLVLSKIP